MVARLTACYTFRVRSFRSRLNTQIWILSHMVLAYLSTFVERQEVYRQEVRIARGACLSIASGVKFRANSPLKKALGGRRRR